MAWAAPNAYAHPLLLRTSGNASCNEMVSTEIVQAVQVRARPATPWDFFLVARCHVSLIFYLFAWGSLPLAGWRLGVLWELEGVTPPTESAVPNDYWSAGRLKKKDKNIMFTRRAILCTMKGHQKRGWRGKRALKRHAGNVSTGRRRSGPKAPTNHEGWSSHSTTSRNRKRSSGTIDPHRKLAIQECRGPHKRGISCR